MENAVKALLIAAGMLMVVLIISVLVLSYNRISTYYEKQHELIIVEQAQEFNTQFEDYNRKGLRGNELITLINLIRDYNDYSSEIEGYERITITIDLQGYLSDLKYGDESKSESILTNNIITNQINDEEIKDISTLTSSLVSSSGIPNLTDTKLQKLSANISNIVDFEYAVDKEQYKTDRAKLLNQILKTSYDKNTDDNDIKDIIKATYKYYQYTQFKRACFDCTSVKYDLNSNRVNEMNFVVQVKNGSIVLD